METFLFNNAPAVVVSGIVAFFLIKTLCISKDDAVSKKDFEGMGNRINCVAEKVSENDKNNAVELEKQHRKILEDVSNKFSSKDTVGEIRNDVSRIELSFNNKFEKLDEKIDTFMEKILDAISKK